MVTQVLIKFDQRARPGFCVRPKVSRSRGAVSLGPDRMCMVVTWFFCSAYGKEILIQSSLHNPLPELIIANQLIITS